MLGKTNGHRRYNTWWITLCLTRLVEPEVHILGVGDNSKSENERGILIKNYKLDDGEFAFASTLNSHLLSACKS